ncbi:uncharacterized protein EURHEDRAFT_81380 [Aspergillus ruber CBS 135680]|uniref:Uncharacterized protein n=1 Tax=Aspergillus ruber (strain CBS 135680) TaxID=1388766 RepID=A0A017SC86_ASPRC|nr:uncharacterized protein EURHEDRAFT_81380 [Aspergillus ruber CBS 135680]EYE94643.1 hypothetical protein EURHEDRAFT_81380 [Aspergillus ruber CBS 135680]
MADGLNQARALRVAEIINDYRTLLLHICEETIPSPIEEYFEEGHVIMREGHTAAQALMGSNYTPAAVPSNASNEEAERAELQRVILDGSARRFQAHRIYLRIAAAKRWALHRANILRGQQPTAQHAAQLATVSNSFRQELAQITDQYVVSDLRTADLRAGHWLDDDPSLATILRWIQMHPS